MYNIANTQNKINHKINFLTNYANRIKFCNVFYAFSPMINAENAIYNQHIVELFAKIKNNRKWGLAVVLIRWIGAVLKITG